MELVTFINKMQNFSNKLYTLFYLNAAAHYQSARSTHIEEEDKYDDQIFVYDKETQTQKTPSLFSRSDSFKEQKMEDVSYLLDQWKLRYFSKLPKMFKRQKQKQFMELSALKESIEKQLGQVDQKYQWMQREEQVNNESMLSSRLNQKKEYLLKNMLTKQSVQFTLVEQDFSKLMPGKDLNDALIDSYFKVMKTFILPQEISQNSYIFSTYLLHKLTSEIGQQALTGQIDIFAENLGNIVREEVREKYDKVQRWNKKIDIFDKKILVFPINMHVHWFCVIVLNPGSFIEEHTVMKDKCKIVFCDSMFEQRFFVVQAIREYLRLQLQFKRNINIQVTQENAPSFQFLLPRQTNKHDCGLYMLAYIEQLLLNHKQHFANLHEIENWNKLRYFPRRYMHSLRHRVMRLFIELYQTQSSPQKTTKIIQNYLKEKHTIYDNAEKTHDFDFWEEQEFQKFLSFMKVQGKNMEDPLQKYRYLVKFSLTSEVNYLQKDTLSDQLQFSSQQDSEYI